MSAFWDQIEENYSPNWSWAAGALPGVTNAWTAMAEAYGGYFSGIDSMNASRAANDANMAINAQNTALQREFAQNGIRWRVDDAKAAGIHPLAALGGAGASYSPSSISVMPEQDPMGHATGELSRFMGQNVLRSIQNTRTAEEQQAAKLQLATAQADLDGRIIDNQIRASQLRQMNSAGPGMPGTSENFVPGQGNSGIKTKPMERTATMKGRPDAEAGAVAGVGHYMTADGTVIPVPSKDTKEKIEDNLYHETMHFMRNNVLPNFTGGNPPPGYMWDRWRQGYVPYKGASKYYDKKDYGPPKRRK